MKYFLPILLLACTNQTNVSNLSDHKKAFETIAYSNQGIILCDTLIEYNRYLDTIGIITNLKETLISIDSISKQKHILFDSKDSCDALNLVHIKIKNKWHWVYSNSVLEYSNQSKQLFYYNKKNMKYLFGDTSIQIHPLNDFSIGVSNQDGLTGCGNAINATIIDIPQFGSAKIAKVIANIDDEYPNKYFSIDQHDGWEDSIQHINIHADTMFMTVHREYQEGSADLELKFLLKKERFDMLYIRKTNVKDF